MKKNISTLFLVWIGFHAFALLMSYSQVALFNRTGQAETQKFWPFVQFIYTKNEIDPNRYNEYYNRITKRDSSRSADMSWLDGKDDKKIGKSDKRKDRLVKKNRDTSRTRATSTFGIPVGDLMIDRTYFNGIFTQYDLTEFLFYTGLSALFYLYLWLNRVQYK